MVLRFLFIVWLVVFLFWLLLVLRFNRLVIVVGYLDDFSCYVCLYFAYLCLCCLLVCLFCLNCLLDTYGLTCRDWTVASVWMLTLLDCWVCYVNCCYFVVAVIAFALLVVWCFNSVAVRLPFVLI